MPEQISKYPEVTKCPAEQFCALPTGEICVYSIEQIPKMTQITTQELARVVCPPGQRSLLDSAALFGTDGIIAGTTFIVGLMIGGALAEGQEEILNPSDERDEGG